MGAIACCGECHCQTFIKKAFNQNKYLLKAKISFLVFEKMQYARLVASLPDWMVQPVF
jgi:hypothetical protein